MRKNSKAGSIMLPDFRQYYEAIPSGAVVKNLPTKAEDARDKRSIPAWRRCPGEGDGYPLHILAWKITWTEEPGGLRSKGSQT